jgi:hypothetical protein
VLSVQRPEVELLLRCARTAVDAIGATRVRALLRQGVDWDAVIGMAGPHGVIPLLYSNLSVIAPGLVPEGTLEQLRRQYRGNAYHNFLLMLELRRLLALLEAHDISAIPFKGPALACSVYGDLSLRQFGDLDILVRKQDARRAKVILLSQGYRTGFDLSPAQESAYLKSGYAFELARDDGRMYLEVHWAITPRYFCAPLDPERFWERLEPISLAGTTVNGLSPGDLLLALCLHSSKHGWDRLKWVCDIAELLGRNMRIDWESVMRQAEAVGSKRMLFIGLLLARDLLGANLTEQVWKCAQADPVASSLAAQFRDRLFREPDRSPNFFRNRNFQPVHLRMKDRWQEQVRYCLRLVTTPTLAEWKFVALPDRLYFLYAAIRATRVVGVYAPKLFWHVVRACGRAIPHPFAASDHH